MIFVLIKYTKNEQVVSILFAKILVYQIFGGFTPTAKHEYLTKRQENLGMYFEELKKHMISRGGNVDIYANRDGKTHRRSTHSSSQRYQSI